MTVTVTGYTRPSGVVVVQAHDDHGNRLGQVTTQSTYPFLLVDVRTSVAGAVTRLAIAKRTGSYDTASRYRIRHGSTLLRRHTDGTYSNMDIGWNDRQAAVRRREAEARWNAERDGDHHQVLVVFTDGHVERIGDPSRHFEWDQAQARYDALVADPLPGQRWAMVRAENDPQYDDVPWHNSPLKAA